MHKNIISSGKCKIVNAQFALSRLVDHIIQYAILKHPHQLNHCTLHLHTVYKLNIFSDHSLSFLNLIASLANMLSPLMVADLHLSHVFLTTMTITLVFLARSTIDFSPEQSILLRNEDINKQSYICMQHCIVHASVAGYKPRT